MKPESPARSILLCAGCTGLAYFAVGLPLAVLPGWALKLGFGPVMAGFLISAQYVATVLSRIVVGPMIDRSGPRRAIVQGFACGLGAGVATLAALWISAPMAAMAMMLAARILLGFCESLVSTSAMAWGITRLGAQHSARMISWNGIATYAAIAGGAPAGVWIFGMGGIAALGAALLALGGLGLAVILPQTEARIARAPRWPMRTVFGAVLPFGAALALATVGFGIITSFVTLYFDAFGWTNAWMALTAFGGAFIVSRLIFVRSVARHGGLPVAGAFIAVEVAGLAIMAMAPGAVAAIAGAGVTGFGFAMVFPALGVMVIARVPEQSRGTALSTFALFIDVALCLTGPMAGALAQHSTYAAPFAAAAGAAALGLSLVALMLFSRPRP